MCFKRRLQAKYLWTMALMLILSCSPGQEGQEDGMEARAPQWLAISVNLPRISPTRAGLSDKGNDTPYEGSSEDQKVTSARVVLYDDNNMAVYSFDITATDIAVGSFTNAPFTIKARQLKKANYSVLVLLNPNAKVKAVTNKGNIKSQFEAASEVVINDMVSSDGIFMANAHGYIPTTDANWKETQAEAEATNVPVNVQLERSVGKIFVSPSEGVAIDVEGDIASATMKDFAIDVTNKKTFWMRKPGQSLTGNGTATSPAPTAIENESTPPYYQYAIDPNMDNVAANDFNQSTEYPQLVSTGGWEDNKGIYVIENTMNPSAQIRGNSTRALIRLCYKPASLTFEPTDNDSWADYRGKIMTVSELRQKIQDAITMSDEEMEMPQGFKADMNLLSNEEKLFNKSFDSHNLKYYHEGLNIYATYIRHFDDNKQPMLMAYGRYGVVRNHIYKIEIAKVMGPGSPTPPPPGDTPNDEATTYIAINTVVVPWNTRDIASIILN